MSEQLARLEAELTEIRQRLEAAEQALARLQGADASGGESAASRATAAPQPVGASSVSPGTSGGLTRGASSAEHASAKTPAGGLSFGGSPAAEASSDPFGEDRPAVGDSPVEPAADEDALEAEDENTRLLRRLEEVRAAVGGARVAVASDDLVFAERAKSFLAKKGDAVAGPDGDAYIRQCVESGFRLLAKPKYSFPAYEPFHQMVGEVERAFLDHVSAKDGVRFFPLPGESPEDARRRVPESEGQLSEQRIPSLAAPGTVLSVTRRGEIRTDGSVRKATILVSAGVENETTKMALMAADAVARAKRGAGALDKILDGLKNLAQGSPEGAVLREVLNVCWSANEGGSLDSTVRKLTKALEESHGLQMIRVRTGEKFGDRHSTSKFERKQVSSGKKSGTIVEILRPGFVDRNGVAIQKVLVSVSK